MRQVLVVNYGEIQTSRFDCAVYELEEEYGYEGLAWDMVVSSGDFEILADFLSGDGIHAVLEEGASND